MTRRFDRRTWGRRGLKALAAILALPLLYLLAAIIGSAVPANAAWQEPRKGVRIFVRTNGVHTWIMVPVAAAGIDWRPLAPAAHIRDSRYAGEYIAIGYGNRDFYLNTPNWSDLSPRTAVAAAVGRGPGLVHVEHERRPRPGADERPIMLTDAAYRRLARHIMQRLVHFGGIESVQRTPSAGYGSAGRLLLRVRSIRHRRSAPET
jgi:uncharacterized protein (TIGR02117 family)